MPCLPSTCHRAALPAKNQQSPSDTARQKGGGLRASGGGPASLDAQVVVDAWSPRERRWSASTPNARGPHEVVSARAEVVRCSSRSGGTARSGLRASGGGPLVFEEGAAFLEWSPRERRWSACARDCHPPPQVVSARAEVVRDSMPATAAHECGLRASGGGPPIRRALRPTSRWSPRERRWSALRHRQGHRPEVVSARAEVVRGVRRAAWPPCGGLRASGGSPPAHRTHGGPMRWSPRERRWSVPGIPGLQEGWVVSARAEVVRRRAGTGPPRDGGLRASGGGPSQASRGFRKAGWSPRERRWSAVEQARARPATVVSARAEVVRL